MENGHNPSGRTTMRGGGCKPPEHQEEKNFIKGKNTSNKRNNMNQ